MKAQSQNPGRVAVTVLVDDIVNAMGLKAEHGLAILLEKGGQSVLFDTGQSGLLVENAAKLKVDLSRLQAIVLSHGHYDHTGGLMDVLRIAHGATVYAHPDVFQKRYAISQPGNPVSAGIPATRAQIESLAPLVLSDGPVEILPGVRTTGQITRETDFEDTGGPFFLDPNGAVKDDLWDDLSLVFETEHGTGILTGCAHSGVVNILEHVGKLTGQRRVHTLIGGMHLCRASEERIKHTEDRFREFDVKKIGLAHCTGMVAMVRFMCSFPERCFVCHTGVRFPL